MLLVVVNVPHIDRIELTGMGSVSWFNHYVLLLILDVVGFVLVLVMVMASTNELECNNGEGVPRDLRKVRGCCLRQQLAEAQFTVAGS